MTVPALRKGNQEAMMAPEGTKDQEKGLARGRTAGREANGHGDTLKAQKWRNKQQGGKDLEKTHEEEEAEVERGGEGGEQGGGGGEEPVEAEGLAEPRDQRSTTKDKLGTGSRGARPEG